MDAWLSKPVDPAFLLAKVAELLKLKPISTCDRPADRRHLSSAGRGGAHVSMPTTIPDRQMTTLTFREFVHIVLRATATRSWRPQMRPPD